jgi:hypothetical protein
MLINVLYQAWPLKRSETSTPRSRYPVDTAPSPPNLDSHAHASLFILAHWTLNCEPNIATGSGHSSSLNCRSDNFNFTAVSLTLFHFTSLTFWHSQKGVSRVSTPLHKCVAAHWEPLTQTIHCQSATTALSVFLSGYGPYAGDTGVNFQQGQWH